jgi:hypothetical protein
MQPFFVTIAFHLCHSYLEGPSKRFNF